MDEVDNPTFSAISLSVSPPDCRSRIRDAHVSMASTLRHSVIRPQRHSVTEIRFNSSVTIGDRTKEWRERRKMTVEQLAQRVGLRPSTIHDLERGDSKSSKKLHVIAQILRINVNFLETGRGEAEDMSAKPRDEAGNTNWPFSFARSRFDGLPSVDRETIEAAVLALVISMEKAKPKPTMKKKAS
jgi:transcriptional regulator with XRE-family HTH domain